MASAGMVERRNRSGWAIAVFTDLARWNSFTLLALVMRFQCVFFGPLGQETVCRHTGNTFFQTAATFQLGYLKIHEAIGRHIEAAQTSSFKTLKLRRRMLQVTYFLHLCRLTGVVENKLDLQKNMQI